MPRPIGSWAADTGLTSHRSQLTTGTSELCLRRGSVRLGSRPKPVTTRGSGQQTRVFAVRRWPRLASSEVPIGHPSRIAPSLHPLSGRGNVRRPTKETPYEIGTSGCLGGPGSGGGDDHSGVEGRRRPRARRNTGACDAAGPCRPWKTGPLERPRTSSRSPSGSRTPATPRSTRPSASTSTSACGRARPRSSSPP